MTPSASPSATLPPVPSAEPPELVTIRDVEIVSTGTYQLASGEATFTADDLVAAVAALDDPAVQTPRLKIGHTDPRFDGEPALGKAENLRVSEDGQTLLCDFTGVPRWLADIMPSAYPSRSIEGWTNAETASGKKHALVITAVALLGVSLPGVATLDDLQSLYDEPEVELVGTHINAQVGGSMARSVLAAVEVEDVRRAYYETLTGDQAWWWIRAIRLDPEEVIVDDDEGGLYRVPFSIKGSDISFSDPVAVRIEYVDTPADVKAESGQRTAAIFASRAESRPDTTQEVDTMDPSVIRERLGLAEDASDDDVLAAIDAARAPVEPEPEPEAPETEPDGEEPTAEVPEGMALIDTETLNRLREGAEMGVAARRQQVEAERSRLLSAAIEDGRIPPSRREHYAALLEADEDGTRQLLASLAPGLIPVNERGASGEAGNIEAEAYPKSWLPELNRRGQGTTITVEA